MNVTLLNRIFVTNFEQHSLSFDSSLMILLMKSLLASLLS